MRGYGPATPGRAAKLRVLVLALMTLAAAPSSQAQGATPAADQIAALNAQREANGIPAGIVEVPAWTDACRRHMAYIAANGGVLTHEEDPSNPGYSPEGAEAGRRAVITPLPEAFDAAGAGFAGTGNAFEFAPLHLMQVLAPALSRMGVWGGCATSSAGYDRPASRPALYTYPGDGATGVYESEVAAEGPFVPGDFAGLPHGTATGPHILVMALGTEAGRIASASLTGPSGPVEIRSVDNETDGLVGYMPPGGMIIPVSPLAAGTYSVAATFEPSRGTPLSRTWTFSASAPAAAPAGAIPTIVPVSLRFQKARPAGRSVAFTLDAGQSLVGRRASVTMYRVVRRCAAGTCRERRHGRTLRSVIGRLALRQKIVAPRPVRGRAIKVIVETQPFTSGGLSYSGGQAVGRWAAS